jgi:hypothetical protein
MGLTGNRCWGVIAPAQVPPEQPVAVGGAGPNGSLSHIVRATLWRSSMRLVGASVRLAMGVSLGGLPHVGACVPFCHIADDADASLRPGSRPVGGA